MALPSLVTTPGAVDANSYADEAYLLAYVERRTQPVTLPAETRPLLLQAMVMLEGMVPKGYKTNLSGALLWPRTGVLKIDNLNLYAANEIPVYLKDAQCEIASQFVGSDILADADMAGLSDVKIGPLTFTANPATEPYSLNSTAKLLLAHLYFSTSVPGASGTAGLVPVVRV